MNFIGIKPEASKASAAPRELNAVARAIAAEPVANAISPVVLIGLVRLAEFLGVAAIGTATYTAYVYPYDEPTLFYASAILLISAAAVLAFQAFEIYNIAAFRSHIHQLTRLALAWTLVFLVAFAISFFGKLDVVFSRVWAASWYSVGLAALLIGRLALTAMVRRWARNGRLVRRVVIVGGGREGESLVRALESEADSDVRICGVFDDRGGERSRSPIGTW
jgi:FlaA1/EpsC-like NDP-sugar epimerase